MINLWTEFPCLSFTYIYDLFIHLYYNFYDIWWQLAVATSEVKTVGAEGEVSVTLAAGDPTIGAASGADEGVSGAATEHLRNWVKEEK